MGYLMMLQIQLAWKIQQGVWPGEHFSSMQIMTDGLIYLIIMNLDLVMSQIHSFKIQAMAPLQMLVFQLDYKVLIMVLVRPMGIWTMMEIWILQQQDIHHRMDPYQYTEMILPHKIGYNFNLMGIVNWIIIPIPMQLVQNSYFIVHPGNK